VDLVQGIKDKEHELKGANVNPITVQMHNLKKIVDVQNLVTKGKKPLSKESKFLVI
jgi:hypothetical protein